MKVASVLVIITTLSITTTHALTPSSHEMYMLCHGSRYTKGHQTLQASESAVLLIDETLRKDRMQNKGKAFGLFKLSRSYIPWSRDSSLRLCHEDELKYNLEPICILDADAWPPDVASLYRDCTLDKISGKFQCELKIFLKRDSKPETYRWDYVCSRVERPGLKQ